VRNQTYYVVAGALALLVGALAVTNQSFWIDEGAAAVKAMQPSLGGWWHSLRSEGNSNLQLLGELFYLWGWVKIFGASEIALRASNIPFLAGAIVALAWGMAPQRRTQIAITLLALTNAFLCYYVSEARPYIVLFACASLTVACLFRLLREPETCWHSGLWFRLFCVGMIGLCATSLIAVPWALAAMAAVLFWSGLRETWHGLARFRLSAAILVAALGALGFYYLWTMRLGARASGVGRTGWSNAVFIFYELLGLAGLGPGRLSLRNEGIFALRAYVPGITIGAAAILILFAFSARSLRNDLTKRRIVFFLIAVAGPFLLVFAAGIAGHMRLLGRHLTPLLPFLLAGMSVGLSSLLATGKGRVLAAALLSILLLSAFEIRFAPRHRRDDYRGAAVIARRAVQAHQHVWWLADFDTARYYHVPLDSPLLATSPDLPNNPPDMVIFSKPDIYDPTNVVRPYLQRNDFSVTQVLQAFEILTRPQVR